MRLVSLHDRAELAPFFRKAPHHLFEVGDLDDAFWPYTTWYGQRDGVGALRQVALLFTRFATPVLMLYGDPPVAEARVFTEALLPVLPRRMYGHIGTQLIDILESTYNVTNREEHRQMRLIDAAAIPIEAGSGIDTPSLADVEAIQKLYQDASPETAFDPQSLTLALGLWRCARSAGRIVSIAGLHVFSEEYRVAALGNVATHPAFRRQGLSRRVCGALVRSLLHRGIETIGLDVKADNAAAIAMYEGMGFRLGPAYYGCNLTGR
jgi:ribosomal protein S18 acetylase RimI-like enzyme